MLHQLTTLLPILTLVSGLIIPEELPSLLSLLYSNIPPVKKGTDSRVGFGFRLGPHADFQVMLEVGPQSNTGAIGPDGEPPSKRDTLTMQNPQTLVNIINTWKMPKPQEDEDPLPSDVDTETAATEVTTEQQIPESGGGWLNSWRDAIAKNSLFSKIKFKPVAGIDYRIDRLAPSRRQELPAEKFSYVDRLSQLYMQRPAVT